MNLYPKTVANPNVPGNVFIVGEKSYTSGEIIETYYIDKDGMIWVVDDWKDSEPRNSFVSTLCSLTGDTEQMITDRWKLWKVEQDEAKIG